MLELNGLCKRFGNKTVADNICLTVGRGKILAVLGRSGCGKSTLLNMIAGIVRPDGGEIWLNGENITRMPPEKRRISLMFQDYALFPHMSALENAAFGLKMQKMPKAEAERLAMAALAEVGLENEAHRKPENFPEARSNGWRWRALWLSALPCCCWTNRFPVWTRICATGCAA